MINILTSNIASYLDDYGCSSSGRFNANTPTLGPPIDDFDKAISKWKHCRKCVPQQPKPYDFDHENMFCCK